MAIWVLSITAVAMAILALLIFSGLLSQIHCSDYCSYMKIPPKWQQRKKSVLCCDISNSQWKLISWYFARVSSFIEISELIPERQTVLHPHLAASTFSKYFAMGLYNQTGFDSYTQRVDYAQRDETKDKQAHFQRAYKWHAELSNKSKNNTHVLYIDAELPAYRKISSKAFREDEPDYGAVVIASSILTLNNYLKGDSRKPFLNKRANYVLIVYREPTRIENWDKLAAAVLAKMWMYHGILNAILLSTCMWDVVIYTICSSIFCHKFHKNKKN